jgi:ankyrin repeat protein
VRRLVAIGGLAFCVFFFAPPANGQEIAPRSYLFLEVKDSSGKEVPGATVTVSNAAGRQLFNAETDGGGAIHIDLQNAADHRFEVQISKSAFQTYQQLFFPIYPYQRQGALTDAIPSRIDSQPNSQPPPIEIVMSKAPLTAAEKRIADAEERKLRFLLAVKRGDIDGVKKFLQEGVSPNTSDSRGVPAIAWAAFTGDSEMIAALLADRADVRDSRSPAHKTLLTYLTQGMMREAYLPGRSGGKQLTQEDRLAIHDRTVTLLIEAGAGVKSAEPSDELVLNRALTLVPDLLSVDIVRMLISRNTSINDPDGNGKTALMLAAGRASADFVGILLDAGAKSSINARDKNGRSALMNAAECFFDSGLKSARLLIGDGADTSGYDESGASALMLAAKSGSNATVKLLLEKGAATSINSKDKKGETALIHAILGHGLFRSNWIPIDIVKTLVAAGADVNSVDSEGKSGLMYATSDSMQEEVVKFLIESGARVNEVDSDGHSVLMRAAKTASINDLQALLQAGARSSINLKDNKGETALTYAVSQYHGLVTSVTKILIEAGANVNDANPDGKTPLMSATQKNSWQVVQQLLSAGASVNAKDDKGRTALMYIQHVDESALLLVNVLIGAGATVNASDENGLTPLMIATLNARSGYLEVVRALLQSGAAVNAKQNNGMTALMYAAYGYGDSKLGVIKLLQASGADVNATDSTGRTPLMFLPGFYSSASEVIKTLISAGANVNSADRSGTTVLMYVARKDSSQILKLILDAGASVNAVDRQGKTALMYTIDGDSSVSAEKVKLLLSSGADPNIANSQGETALSLARQRPGYESTVAILEAATPAR